MSRYVNIEWLKADFDEANEICFFYLNSESRETFEELKKIVEQAPSIDIVHCGECKAYDSECEWCGGLGLEMKPDDFCSYGERSGE